MNLLFHRNHNLACRFRLAIALVASFSTCGCSSIWHSFTEVTFEGEAEFSRETLESRWGDLKKIQHAAGPEWRAVSIRLTGVQEGTARERVVTGEVTRRLCVRHRVGTSVLEGGRETDTSWGLWVLVVWGCALVASDLVLFVPWLIAGHTWLHPCAYTSKRVLNPRSEVVERAVEREIALAGRKVEFRVGDVHVGDGLTDAGGRLQLSYPDIIRFSKGRSGDLEMIVDSAGSLPPIRLSPEKLLTMPWGSAPDWSAGARDFPPALTVEVREETQCLRIRIRNQGAEDACQVACVVAGTASKSDGRCAVFGRIRAGATVEAPLWLDGPGRHGRIEFFEARDQVPEPVEFGKR